MAGEKTPSHDRLSPSLILLMAFACGAMVANLYYAQTLIEAVGPEIGLSKALAGAIVTLTQLGYGIGLFAIVPLGDLFENRRLALIMTAGTCLGSVGIALSQGPVLFLGASLLTGVCATGAQILLPLASHLSSPQRQGRIIGQIMAGLLTGIMLARPLASFMAEWLGWRSVFFLSAGLMALIAVALGLTLPRREPPGEKSYGEILSSMIALTKKNTAVSVCARSIRRRSSPPSIFSGRRHPWCCCANSTSAKTGSRFSRSPGRAARWPLRWPAGWPTGDAPA